MPIYDFECKNCGYITELLRKMSEPNVTICPTCSQEAFEKQLSAPSFQLSGTGWYATDFKQNKQEKSTKKEPESNTKEAAAASCAPGCACH